MARRGRFNKNQKRDKNGKWTSGGASSSKSKTQRNQKNTRRKLAVGSVGIGAGVGFLIAGAPGALAGAGIVAVNNARLGRKFKRTRKG